MGPGRAPARNKHRGATTQWPGRLNPAASRCQLSPPTPRPDVCEVQPRLPAQNPQLPTAAAGWLLLRWRWQLRRPRRWRWRWLRLRPAAPPVRCRRRARGQRAAPPCCSFSASARSWQRAGATGVAWRAARPAGARRRGAAAGRPSRPSRSGRRSAGPGGAGRRVQLGLAGRTWRVGAASACGGRGPAGAAGAGGQHCCRAPGCCMHRQRCRGPDGCNRRPRPQGPT